MNSESKNVDMSAFRYVCLPGRLVRNSVYINLQNEIYDHRRSAPFVFDWVYKKLKNKDEELMNKNAETLVKEYQEKRNHK